jgi:serine phosphatase RsbU (regulator of sigma subunit)
MVNRWYADLRLRRYMVVAVGVVLEAALAVIVQQASPGRVSGLSGALGAGIAVTAGLAAGGRAGAITGGAGGVFFALVARNHDAQLVWDGVAVVALWGLLGATAGVATRRLRLRAVLERDRLAALQEVTERLSSALSEDEIAQAVIEVGIPAVGADAAAVYVATPNRQALRLAAHSGFPAGVRGAAADVDLNESGPVPEAIRAGRTLVASSPAELLDRYPAVRDALRRSGEAAAIIVPLQLEGEIAGGVHFAFMRPRVFDSDVLALVDTLARQCAAALERARLYEREHETSVTLQRSLLPGRLPQIPWLDVASIYRPQESAAEVGGDFYDLVALSDDACLAFIGDVSGKGIAAASVTSQVRYTIRTLARSVSSPAAMLSELNGVLLESALPSGLFCTVAAVRFERDRTGVRATVACGGHPLPLVIRAGGTVEEAGRPGQLIGALPTVTIRDRTVALDPGDRLLLYTDGITEARRDGAMLGEERLIALLEGAGNAPPADIVAQVAELAERHADRAQDDAAILCFAVERPPSAR